MKEVNSMTLGERISQKRKAAGLSQEALGNILGVSRQAIYKWETDQAVPELEKLIQMSQAFDISLGWLVNEEEELQKNADQNNKSTEEIKKTVEDSKATTSNEIRKGNKNMMLFLFGIIVVVTVVFGFRFHSLEKKYDQLQNTLNNYNYYTQNQINNIVNSVQQALNQYSDSTVNKSIIVKSIDFKTNTIQFELISQPKKYSEGMEAIFHIKSGANTIDIDGELYADHGYHAIADVELTDEIVVTVEFKDGKESVTEKIAEYYQLYTDSFGVVDLENPIWNHVGEIKEELRVVWYKADSFYMIDGNYIVEPIQIKEYRVSLYEDGKKIGDYKYLPEKREIVTESIIVECFERPLNLTVDTENHVYQEVVTVIDQYGRELTVTASSAIEY